MFRCYFCKQITPPKTTRHSVVIESRPKQYSARRREAKRRGGFRDRDRDREREESFQDRGGQGIEIIREVDACPECAAKQLRAAQASAAVASTSTSSASNTPATTSSASTT